MEISKNQKAARELIEPEFAKQVINEVAMSWGVNTPIFVRWFENVVYKTIHKDSVIYIRLTSGRRRTKLQLESELALVTYLGNRKSSAVRPIKSRTGENVLEFEGKDQRIFACVFTECEGSDFQITPPSDLGSFCHSAGKSMALLHTELKQFTKPSSFIRFDWMEDRWNRFDELIPSDEIEVRSHYKELKRWWSTLDDQAHSGLIHGDFTVKNLRYGDQQISLFDFDGCCDHWYGYELACFLHYFVNFSPEHKKLIYDQTLDGYAEVSGLSSDFFEQIPIFGKMKLLRSFLVLAEEWGFDNLNTRQEAVYNQRRRMISGPPIWG